MLYGLSRERGVVHSEAFVADSPIEAKTRGRERKDHFDAVEVWEGSICLFRSRRGD